VQDVEEGVDVGEEVSGADEADLKGQQLSAPGS